MNDQLHKTNKSECAEHSNALGCPTGLHELTDIAAQRSLVRLRPAPVKRLIH